MFDDTETWVSTAINVFDDTETWVSTAINVFDDTKTRVSIAVNVSYDTETRFWGELEKRKGGEMIEWWGEEGFINTFRSDTIYLQRDILIK